MQNVTIIGPNLPSRATPNGETFIVHATSCRDAARDQKRYGDRSGYTWTTDASSTTEVAAEIYADHIAEGSMTADEALNDVHFCPCVELPITASFPTCTACGCQINPANPNGCPGEGDCLSGLTFTLTIDLANDAARTRSAILDALQQTHNRIAVGGMMNGPVKDANGNTVGRTTLEQTPTAKGTERHKVDSAYHSAGVEVVFAS